MLFTYWKTDGKGGQQQTSTIPSNNRPPTNVDVTTLVGGPKNQASGHAKPNPIKHWRKQLMPIHPTSSTRVSTNQVDNPSISIVTNKSDDKHTIYNQLLSTEGCLGVKNANDCIGGTNNVKRSASTVVSKKYSSSTKQYLQKRGKTFEQNQTLGKNTSDYSYNSAIPSYNSQDNLCKTVIFKPSNATFQIQGSVTASSYTAKIKQESLCTCTINPFDPLKKTQQPCCTVCCIALTKTRKISTNIL